MHRKYKSARMHCMTELRRATLNPLFHYFIGHKALTRRHFKKNTMINISCELLTGFDFQTRFLKHGLTCK